jgi:hypothetical protein
MHIKYLTRHILIYSFYRTGEEIKLEDLSDCEIKRFRQALASGELSKMIEPWTPWWKKPSGLVRFCRIGGSERFLTGLLL